MQLYSQARDYAGARGIILADTKFEFGYVTDKAGNDTVAVKDSLMIDEIFTPDSSRFWPADDWEPGREQQSFDKQIVRNYLETVVNQGHWDKTAPGPALPEEVTDKAIARYLEAYQRLTGETLQL